MDSCSFLLAARILFTTEAQRTRRREDSPRSLSRANARELTPREGHEGFGHFRLFNFVLFVCFVVEIPKPLRDDNTVAGSQQDILLEIAFDNRIIVNDVLGDLCAFPAYDLNFIPVRKNRQSAGASKNLQ